MNRVVWSSGSSKIVIAGLRRRCQVNLAGQRLFLIDTAVIIPFYLAYFHSKRNGPSVAFTSITASRAKMKKRREP
jgi:hypothetical protein